MRISDLANMYRQRSVLDPAPSRQTGYTGFRMSQPVPLGTGNPRQTGYAAPRTGPRGTTANPRQTGYVAPRTGPRGTTADDVRRVASQGKSAIPPTSLSQQVDPRSGGLPSGSPFRPFEMTPEMAEQIQAGIIGGPGPGYGEKYGGFTTQAQQQAAIEGEAMLALQMALIARDKAAELGAPAYEQYDYELDTSRGGLAGQRISESRNILGNPLSDLASQMSSGGTPSAEDYYGANMARMNALRGTGLYSTDIGEQLRYNTRASVEPQAYQNLERELSKSGADRYQAVANLIGETPLYEYARQLATARYGMDPSLAAGLFTPEMDMSYDKQQKDYERFTQGFRELSDAEYLFDTYGPEAYEEYRARKAEQMMFGSEEEMIEEENLQTDLGLEDQYGFRPSDVKNFDTDLVRALMTDPLFGKNVKAGIDKVMAGEYGDQVAADFGLEYFKQTNDPMGARVLAEIIASFDIKAG